MNKGKKAFPYRLVDVFTSQALEGNGLAVFTDATGLDGPTMRKIAREMNLSETTFVFPATRKDCTARVRIFTPAYELPFAGHPTLGTAWVLMNEGRTPAGVETFLLEEGVGPVKVRVSKEDPPKVWLTTPPITFGRTYGPAVCAKALGISIQDLLGPAPQMGTAGNPTVFIALRSKEAVDRTWLDHAGVREIMGADREPLCVFVFAQVPGGVYSRMFAPEYNVPEDPATGSSTGPLAAFMMQHGLVPKASGTSFVSEQGTKMGRRSLLYVEIKGENGCDGIDVGGHVTPVAEAMMYL